METTPVRWLAALTLAGVLWGGTLPLTKLALESTSPGWLAAARFAVAGAVLALIVGWHALRAVATPLVLATGAVGYGAVVVLQNAGVASTSVSHAALIVGVVPLLVAVAERLRGRPVPRPVWAGLVVALAGLVLVVADGGGPASLAGDALVGGSALLTAAMLLVQPRVLRGRSPLAVTAVQFGAASGASAAWSVGAEGLPTVQSEPSGLAVVAGLALVGTLLPFALFAAAQAHVSPSTAGAFVNLEPLVGALLGWTLLAEAAGTAQLVGAAVLFAGLAVPFVAVGASRTRRPDRHVPLG